MSKMPRIGTSSPPPSRPLTPDTKEELSASKSPATTPSSDKGAHHLSEVRSQRRPFIAGQWVAQINTSQQEGAAFASAPKDGKTQAVTDTDRENAATTIQRWYRATAKDRSESAAKRTPYPDEQTLYWANRPDWLTKERRPDDLRNAFAMYRSTRSLYSDEPAFLYSRRRADATRFVACTYIPETNLSNSNSNCFYRPRLYGEKKHRMDTNLIWLLGVMHHMRSVVMAHDLDDEIVVEGSDGKPGDAEAQATEKILATYPREILGLLQAGHYYTTNDENPLGLQVLKPNSSAKTAVIQDVRTPARMPKTELKAQLAEHGISVEKLTPGNDVVHRNNGFTRFSADDAFRIFSDNLKSAHDLEDGIRQLRDEVVEAPENIEHFVQPFHMRLRDLRRSLALLRVSSECIDSAKLEDLRKENMSQALGKILHASMSLLECTEVLFNDDSADSRAVHLSCEEIGAVVISLSGRLGVAHKVPFHVFSDALESVQTLEKDLEKLADIIESLMENSGDASSDTSQVIHPFHKLLGMSQRLLTQLESLSQYCSFTELTGDEKRETSGKMDRFLEVVESLKICASHLFKDDSEQSMLIRQFCEESWKQASELRKQLPADLE